RDPCRTGELAENPAGYPRGGDLRGRSGRDAQGHRSFRRPAGPPPGMGVSPRRSRRWPGQRSRPTPDQRAGGHCFRRSDADVARQFSLGSPATVVVDQGPDREARVSAPLPAAAVVCRPMRPDEAGAVSAMVYATFQSSLASGYSEEGQKEFLQYAAPDRLVERLDRGHRILVATEGGQIVGVIEV